MQYHLWTATRKRLPLTHYSNLKIRQLYADSESHLVKNFPSHTHFAMYLGHVTTVQYC